tara:strand:+ start:272 stop:1018 length:747 start_codon:yes stop_codon:yes gene_type:complete
MEIIQNFSDENILVLEKGDLLRPLIKFNFIENELSKVLISEEKVNGDVKSFREKNKLTSDDNFAKFLEVNKLTSERFINQIEKQLRIKSFSLEKFSNKCEYRFLDKRYLLDEVTYSLLRLKNFYQARELKMRIIEKEATFSDIAIAYSNGFEKKSGGLIGPTSLANAHPTLIDILRTANEGDITGPHKIEDWFVVVRLEKFTPAKLDEVTFNKMAQELFEEWVNEQVDEIHNAIIKRINSSFQATTNS